MNSIIAITILVVSIVGFIMGNKLIIKYFQGVYNRTGKNPFTKLHQIFSALIFTPILLNLANPDVIPVPILVAIGLVSSTILVLMNLKLKDPTTIAVCSLFQIIFGVFFFIRAFLMILIAVWNGVSHITGFDQINYNPMKIVVLKGGKLKEQRVEGDLTVENNGNDNAFIGNDIVSADAARRAQTTAFAEAERERNNEAAEAYAQSYGFSSADEAEDYGIKTGKKD